MNPTSDQKSARRRAPLLVRLLARLPGPWWAWTVAAVSLYPIMIAAGSTMCGPRAPGLGSVVFYATSCAFAGWATLWAWRRIEALRPLVARLTGDSAEDPFRGADSTWWALALAFLTPVPYLAPFALNCPRTTALELYAAAVVAALPLMSVFWMFVIVARGLLRLGARPLRLEPFERDRALGLRPLGSLAFGLYMVYAAVTTSLALVTSYERLQLLSTLAFSVIGLGMFFLQMRGLRRQMLAGKAAHTEWARELYAAVVESVRRDPSPEGLDRQAHRVLAAAEIKREVAGIQEWPVDDSLLRTVVAIGTSITAAILARLILTRVGL
ncbi:MAG: hypothetical protein ACRDGM_02770 [bacterium]